MNQDEFTELARYNKYLTQQLFDIIEGLTMINLSLVERLLANGLLRREEVTESFDILRKEVADMDKADLRRFAVEAAADDINRFISSGYLDLVRERMRRRTKPPTDA